LYASQRASGLQATKAAIPAIRARTRKGRLEEKKGMAINTGTNAAPTYRVNIVKPIAEEAK